MQLDDSIQIFSPFISRRIPFVNTTVARFPSMFDNNKYTWWKRKRPFPLEFRFFFRNSMEKEQRWKNFAMAAYWRNGNYPAETHSPQISSLLSIALLNYDYCTVFFFQLGKWIWIFAIWSFIQRHLCSGCRWCFRGLRICENHYHCWFDECSVWCIVCTDARNNR